MKSLTPLQRESWNCLGSARRRVLVIWSLDSSQSIQVLQDHCLGRADERADAIAKIALPKSANGLPNFGPVTGPRDNRSSWLFDLQLWTFFFGAMAFAAMEFLTLSSR